MSHDDFAFEPQRGLPAKLPAGEQLLWQGTPEWRSLAIRAYHVRKVAAYFLALVLVRIAVGLSQGHALSAMALSCLLLIGAGTLAIGLLSLLAYLTAGSTVYSITSRRVLLRHGVAVPLTMNVPLKFIDHAGVKCFADGTGDIALTLPHRERVGYIISWPHLRPGHYAHPEPSFRALTDAPAAAKILSEALAAEAGYEAPRFEVRPAQPATHWPLPAADQGSAGGRSPAAA